MMMVGPLILLLLAQPTLFQAVSRKYQFVDVQTTWFGAQAYCQEHFADLATMETEEDWAEVRQMLVDSGQNVAWMGLYDDVDSWTWSIDGAWLYEAGPDPFGNWIPFAANNAGSREHCGLLGGGTIYDHTCESMFFPICYDEPSGTYIPVRDPMTWQDAQRHCREAYTDLASMRSQQEKDSIFSLIDNSNWWIGLSRESWKWSDRSNSSLRVWDNGQPTGESDQCGCFVPNGWHDCGCSWINPFICSAPVKLVLKIGLRTDGSMDLEDPKVQEALLLQKEELLKDRWNDQRFTLSWKKQTNGNTFNTTQD